MAQDNKNPLYPLCQWWLELIQEAKDQKEFRFGRYATECYKFYNGPHNFMWKNEYARADGGFLDSASQVNLPRFMMSISKASDLVDLFSPALIHQYPIVQVTPIERPEFDPALFGIDPNDPASASVIQQISGEMQYENAIRTSIAKQKEFYLNWCQVQGGKKEHARRCVTEALVCGESALFTELYQPAGSKIAYPRSRFVSIDNIIKDPDARNPDEIQWIAIEWTRPVNIVERKYGLKPGSLKGHLQTKATQATPQGKRDARTNRKNSHDLITYYEIFSKNGCGQRLKTAAKLAKPIREMLEEWGDFSYMVVARGVNFPLNLSEDVIESGSGELMFNAAQWPIPFWRDDGSSNDWPVTSLSFKEDPQDVWGISVLKSSIGYIRFVNWALSFLADKVAANAADYFAIKKNAAKDIAEQLPTQFGPYKMIQLDPQFGESIREVISLMEKPNFDTEIWNMVERVLVQIDKATGLSDLLYGATDRAMRSATEAEALNGNSQIRPQEMAAKVDSMYTVSCLKEIQCGVWLLEAEDLEPVLGKYGAQLWQRYVQTQDFDSVARDYKYKLEADSARRTDRATNLRVLTELGQIILPTINSLAMSGQIDQWNWFISQVAEQMQVKVDGALIQPPPEPDPNAPPTPEQQIAQQQLEAAQMKIETEQTKMLGTQQKTAAEIEKIKTQAAIEQLKLQVEQQRAAIKAAGDASSVKVQEALAKIDLVQKQHKSVVDMQSQLQKMKADMVRAEIELNQARRKFEAIRQSERGQP